MRRPAATQALASCSAGLATVLKASLTAVTYTSLPDRCAQGVAMKEIRFYRANERPFGAFSNLFRRPIVFEGQTFPTAEHAYQAGKARRPEVRAWLMSAPSPALLAMAAHGLYPWDVTPSWSRIKFDRMRGVLRAKFTQHPDLRELLASTGNARLVETATVDNAVNRLWGEVNGIGKNMLGILLMEVREQLSAPSSTTRATTRKVLPSARPATTGSNSPVRTSRSAKNSPPSTRPVSGARRERRVV